MYVYVDDTYMYILTYINQLTTGWWFKSPAFSPSPKTRWDEQVQGPIAVLLPAQGDENWSQVVGWSWARPTFSLSGFPTRPLGKFFHGQETPAPEEKGQVAEVTTGFGPQKDRTASIYHHFWVRFYFSVGCWWLLSCWTFGGPKVIVFCQLWVISEELPFSFTFTIFRPTGSEKWPAAGERGSFGEPMGTPNDFTEGWLDRLVWNLRGTIEP